MLFNEIKVVGIWSKYRRIFLGNLRNYLAIFGIFWKIIVNAHMTFWRSSGDFKSLQEIFFYLCWLYNKQNISYVRLCIPILSSRVDTISHSFVNRDSYNINTIHVRAYISDILSVSEWKHSLVQKGVRLRSFIFNLHYNYIQFTFLHFKSTFFSAAFVAVQKLEKKHSRRLLHDITGRN